MTHQRLNVEKLKDEKPDTGINMTRVKLVIYVSSFKEKH